eukprot:g26692.t1
MTNNESVRGQIDQAADRFDAALQRGETPRIEDFLAGWTGPERTQLLNELLRMELEFLGQSSKRPSEETFIERFPQDTELVRRVFQEEVADRFKLDDTAARSADESTVRRAPSPSAPTSPHLPAASTPSPGTFGDYELLEEIARGGMGVVYKARQTSLNRIVALKMIKSGELAGHEEVQRFRNEAEAAARLDHPNIVPIHEVGEHDGRHFFSMGYVEGRGLDALLKEGPLPPRDAAALIRTIAEAVQYAHDKGIVHRDLKPANVLLAASGVSIDSQNLDRAETANVAPADTPRSDTPKITDFGLAKNISADSGMTATGQILGTPSYMPPEQASGQSDEVGPLSDVYSLGAMLYATLTGRPSFQAASVMETLKQVADQEPVSPRALNPGVDRDLETICLKCLQKDAGKRYASAQSLVDELDRLLTHKPIYARPVGRIERGMRWSRRNRTLSIVGGAALTMLLSLAIGGPLMALQQAKLKQNAKDETLRADQKAEELQSSLDREQKLTSRLSTSLDANQQTLGRFIRLANSKPLLKEPRFKPVLKELMDEAFEHYRRFIVAHEYDTNTEIRSKLTNALGEVAYISATLGSHEAAIETYSEALVLQQALVHEFPSVEKHQVYLATLKNNLGNLYHKKGQTRRALEIAKQSLEIRTRLSSEMPTSIDFQSHLADSHNSIGIFSVAVGQLDEARSSYLNALSIRQKLAKEHPDHTELQSELAKIQINIGNLNSETGNLDMALGAFNIASTIWTKLANEHPTVTRFHDLLAGCRDNIANIQQRQGRLQEALASRQLSLTVRKNITRDNPNVVSFTNRLAGGHYNIARLYERLQKPQDALQAYQKALTIWDTLVLDNPTVAEYQEQMAACHNNMGIVYESMLMLQKSLKSHENAMAIREKLLRKTPQSMELQNDLASSFANIGVILQRTGKLQSALKSYLKAIQIQEVLASKHDSVTRYADNLGSSYNNIGNLYRIVGDRTESLKALKRAVAIREKLSTENPTELQFAINLGRSCYGLGINQQDGNQLDQAIRTFGRAIHVLSECRIRVPKSSSAHQLLYLAYHRRGIVLQKAGRFGEASSDWQYAANFKQGTDRAKLLVLAALSAARGSLHLRASKIGHLAMREKISGKDAYYLARVFAQSAFVAETDLSVPSLNRMKLAAEYRKKSLGILLTLGRAGYFKHPGVRRVFARDPDLNPLRHRDDFRQFAKSIGLDSPAWAVRPRSMLLLRATRPVAFNPVHHGFDRFRGYVSGNVDYISHVDRMGIADWWDGDTLKPEEGYSTHLITRHSVEFIKANRDKPFCLYIAHEAVHSPYQGPTSKPVRGVGKGRIKQNERKDIKAAYREMMTEMDRGIGEVVDTLKELKLDRNTLVIFLSDNGANRNGSNGKLRGFKGSVWEGGHRVPAIAWWPGRIKPGTVNRAPCISIDIMPTILDAAGVISPAGHRYDGISLLGQLEGGPPPSPERTLFWDYRRKSAVRRGRWKLVVDERGLKGQPGLFDLKQDPAEQTNVAGQHPDRVKELQAALREWKKDEYRVLTSVRIAFYNALVAQESVNVAQKLVDVAKQGVTTTKSLKQAQKASDVEVLQAQVEFNQANILLTKARNRKQAAWKELRTVIGNTDIAETTLTGEWRPTIVDADRDTLLQQILSQSPEITVAQQNVSRAQAALARAQVQPIPNVTVQGGLQYDYSTRDPVVNLQLSLPIPVRNRNQGNISAAHSDWIAASRELERRQLAIRNRFATAYERYANARYEVEQYRTAIIPDASKSLELVKSVFDKGETTYLRLLTAQRSNFQARVSYLNAVREWWSAKLEIDGLLLKDGLQDPDQ